MIVTDPCVSNKAFRVVRAILRSVPIIFGDSEEITSYANAIGICKDVPFPITKMRQ